MQSISRAAYFKMSLSNWWRASSLWAMISSEPAISLSDRIIYKVRWENYLERIIGVLVILGPKRLERYWELHPPIEWSLFPSSPVSVSSLLLFFSELACDIQVVAPLNRVLEYGCPCLPYDHSDLKFLSRGRCDINLWPVRGILRFKDLQPAT